MKRLLQLPVLLSLLSFSIYSQGAGIKVVHFTSPGYPPTAKAVGAGGAVEVFAELDKDGNVVSADAINGHPLLKQVSRMAALSWKFEESPSPDISRSLIIAFYFGEGRLKVIEKSEKESEDVTEVTAPSYARVELRTTTVVPELLLLPREKGKLKTESCPLHGEEMAVEILPVHQSENPIISAYVMSDDDGVEGDNESERETYDEATQKYFPNANSYYNGNGLYAETQHAEVRFCRICRLKQRQWEIEHRLIG